MALPTEPYVVVLGVAQDGGHPHPGCRRPCCAAAWADPARGHRVCSLGLVDPRTGRRWLLDASPDLGAQLHALGEGPLAGVFLTHAHLGHYLGLAWLGREAMGVRGVPVWAMPRMAGFLRDNGPWDQLLRLGNVELRGLVEGEEVVLADDLRVAPLLVPHRAEYSETVGFVVQGPRRRLLYLPDLDTWARSPVPLAELCASMDLLFVDATFHSGAELPGVRLAEVPHPLVLDTLERLAPLPPALRARVRLLHLNHTNPLLDPTSAASAEVAAAGVGVAREGQVVAL